MPRDHQHMVISHEDDKYEKEAEKRTLNMIREELQDDMKDEDADDEISKEFNAQKDKDMFDEK